MDRADLVAALETEGWDVNDTEWSAPDAQDFAFWSAKYERENDATPERLREILGWHTIANVADTRRITDQLLIGCKLTNAEHNAYLADCFRAGWILDKNEWLDARSE